MHAHQPRSPRRANRLATWTVVALSPLFALGACDDAEDIGDEIQDVGEEIGDKVEDVGDELEDGIK